MLILMQLIKLFTKHNMLDHLENMIEEYQDEIIFIEDVFYELDERYGVELTSSQLVMLKRCLDDKNKVKSAFVVSNLKSA